MLDCEARVHIGRTVRSRPSAALPKRPGAVRARRAAHFPTVAGMPAEADVLLDQTFHALADVSRRSILVRLSRCPPSVSELAEPVAMSLPAVVPHLDVL